MRRIKRSDNRKGLSPVIATVLLVGMVVVMGLIIFTWFRGLTQEAITKFDQNIQLVCDDVDFDASYSDSSGKGKLSISNRGSVSLFDVKIKVFEPGGFESFNIKDIASDEWPEFGLKGGEAKEIDVSSDIINPEGISVVPILVGTTQKGKQTSYVCDDKLYGQEIY
jgi:flagellin-like protein